MTELEQELDARPRIDVTGCVGCPHGVLVGLDRLFERELPKRLRASLPIRVERLPTSTRGDEVVGDFRPPRLPVARTALQDLRQPGMRAKAVVLGNRVVHELSN